MMKSKMGEEKGHKTAYKRQVVVQTKLKLFKK